MTDRVKPGWSRMPGGHRIPETCADAKRHALSPDGYLEWHEWAKAKAKTHAQSQCPTCGKWMIWKPRTSEARDD